MSVNSTVQQNTIEAYLRMKSLGFDRPWWQVSLQKVTRSLFVRKWQRMRDAHGNVEAYCSPDLICPFTGGMIVRRK